jgi:hypothetical protein
METSEPGCADARGAHRGAGEGSRAREALLWGIIALGAVLRVVEYVDNRSLWYDEAMLAWNLVVRSPAELLRPLDQHQVAAVGYLLLVKLIAEPFNYAEPALRLVPLLSSVASLPLCLVAARGTLSPGAVPVAVGLFALSPNLVYLAQEAKPYASDAAITLVVILLAFEAVRRWPAVAPLGRLALGGALAVWLSTPALLTLGGAGTALLVRWWRAPTRGGFGRLLAVGAVIGAGALPLYALVHRHYARSAHLSTFWGEGFVPLPPRSFDDLLWFPSRFFGLFEEAGLLPAGLAAAVFLVGAWLLRRDRLLETLVLVGPLAAAVAAAALHLYPLYGRPTVFLFPSLALLTAEGVHRVRAATLPTAPVVGAVVLAVLFAEPVLMAGRSLTVVGEREELRPVMDALRSRGRPDDLVYVYYGAEPAFRYYTMRAGMPAGRVVFGSLNRDDLGQYLQELDRLAGRRRVWLVFTHVFRRLGIDEERFLLHHLDRRGVRRDTIVGEGATAYLYDLTGPGPGVGTTREGGGATP